jgi:hypothetical protein
MVEAVYQSNNNLMGNQQSFNGDKKKKHQKKEEPIIDMFPTAEVMRANKEQKFEEQLALVKKVQSLEKSGNKAAEYLKAGIDRNFHMVNIVVPDDIVVRPRPKNAIDIYA